MSKNKLLVIITCACLMAVMVSGLVFAVSPQQQAKVCAEENLSHYLEIIKPIYTDFNLSSEDQLDNAVLGESLANFVIEPNEFAADKAIIEQMQPHAFYVFPVIVDGKSVMDFTVVLDNGQWRPVDIGGRLTTIITEVATANNFDQKQTKILRFAGQTFVLVNKDGNLVAYSPYIGCTEAGFNAQQIISESELGTVLETIHDLYLKNSANKDGEIIYGATCKVAPFKQNSILQRIINYSKHVF